MQCRDATLLRRWAAQADGRKITCLLFGLTLAAWLTLVGILVLLFMAIGDGRSTVRQNDSLKAAGRGVACSAPLPAAAIISMDRLADAMAVVESQGRPRAVGDGGRAAGLLQIHPITVRDVNRILGRRAFTSADRFDPEKSRRIFEIVSSHYVNDSDPRKIAMRWNTGTTRPTAAGRAYWAKVLAAMEGLR